MSAFDDQLAADAAVFLNTEEFGETHTIDGKSVVCVIDENTDGQFTGDLDGVFVTTKQLFVRESDLIKAPVQGKRMIIDDEVHLVLSVSRETPLLRITCTGEGAA